jgi:hypothetical protein
MYKHSNLEIDKRDAEIDIVREALCKRLIEERKLAKIQKEIELLSNLDYI